MFSNPFRATFVDQLVLSLNNPQLKQCLEFYLHNLAVHNSEEVAQWRDAALLYEELDLLRGSAGACICDRPRCLLAGLELCFRLRRCKIADTYQMIRGLVVQIT